MPIKHLSHWSFFYSFCQCWLHRIALHDNSTSWRVALMTENITPENDDEIDLFELALTLWEGKGTIILSTIGAILAGLLYWTILPVSYSGTASLRAAQPSAFTRYAFLSETIRTLSETIESDVFNYKIDNKDVSNAFI